MPNVKNQETLVKIKEDLDGVSAMWVVDYCGLTVKDIQALRTAIRESGASLKVYKNTLMHIALEESNLPTLDDMLAGPSAFVFAGNVKCFSILGRGKRTFWRSTRARRSIAGRLDAQVWPSSCSRSIFGASGRGATPNRTTRCARRAWSSASRRPWASPCSSLFR